MRSCIDEKFNGVPLREFQDRFIVMAQNCNPVLEEVLGFAKLFNRNGVPFPIKMEEALEVVRVTEMIPLCETVRKLDSVCPFTGLPAPFSVTTALLFRIQLFCLPLGRAARILSTSPRKFRMRGFARSPLLWDTWLLASQRLMYTSV